MNIIPSDADSLLVPIQLDAWVVNSSNQQSTVIYEADYSSLASFKSPIPEPFTSSNEGLPYGINLHWSLPDALTHGTTATEGGKIQFPFVPNRWLVARFNAEDAAGKSQWNSKFWVIKSDQVGGIIGVTSTDLQGQITSISLNSPTGSLVAVDANSPLIIKDPSNEDAETTVYTAHAVKIGDTSITIKAINISDADPINAYSYIYSGSSAFLDPINPNNITDDKIKVNDVRIGSCYSIEAWETYAKHSNDSNDQPFLTAVGVGNASFAAYQPYVKNVFSFTDTLDSLPPSGAFNYTYMVVGWFSNLAWDPLNGMNDYIPGIWASQNTWQQQTQNERFNTLLAYFKWQVNDNPLIKRPQSSLYHGLVASVQWPYMLQPPFNPNIPNANNGNSNLQIAIASTATDALAALVQAQPNANSPILASLVQASMYDLLGDYGKPGGQTIIDQKILEASYGTDAGGIIWEVVPIVPQTADQSPASIQLTDAQKQTLQKQLALLNKAQRDVDEAARQLKSTQASLYHLWLKIGTGKTYAESELPATTPDWPDLFNFVQQQLRPSVFNDVWAQYCNVQKAKALLPNPIDMGLANTWAASNWAFRANAGGTSATLESFGLMLKAVAAPRFWHPNDPTLMIVGLNRGKKFGEDGRYNANGTLTCRLPGQTITGLQITGQKSIRASMLQQEIKLASIPLSSTVPSIPSLVTEAFFADSNNSEMISTASGIGVDLISKAITDLMNGTATAEEWIGQAPAAFSLAQWTQAWVPLYLEWKVNYYPTCAVKNGKQQFDLENNWQFDGTKYNWKGTGFDENNVFTYAGRTILTPHASLLFGDKVKKYLTGHPAIDSKELDKLLATIADWDIVSQSLSGLMDQLVTLSSQETFPPPIDKNNIGVPDPASSSSIPSIASLIDGQYEGMPILSTSTGGYFPVQGGFVEIVDLQVIDCFGQVCALSQPNTGQGFQPIIGKGLVPEIVGGNPLPTGFPSGCVQLPPRIIQSTKLEMQILANDGSGNDIVTSTNNSNPICGWVLPNHLDGGISVYDENGLLLGELVPLPAPNNWRPRPGLPGNNPPPKTIGDITNPVLKTVINSIGTQSVATFKDLMKVVDETLWMIDPMGSRQDQSLSVLIGRPLAIVQVSVGINLMGKPYYNQTWDAMAIPDKTKPNNCAPNTDTGNIENIDVQIKLGSLDKRDDGVIGYFLNGCETFYAVHTTDSTDGYIKPIISSSGVYQGDISETPNGNGTMVTMLLDPRGAVHACTGIIPTTAVSLEQNLLEDFLKKLQVSFQTGPIITDNGTLRTPMPAETQGVWNWIQQVGEPDKWETTNIIDADDNARMPIVRPTLREGWLQLTLPKNHL